jgi:hypothetical protein
MPLPPKDELKAWFLTWLDDEHPECESGVDLIVALFEALGEFLDRHAASDDEYQRTIGVCLHTLLEGTSGRIRTSSTSSARAKGGSMSGSQPRTEPNRRHPALQWGKRRCGHRAPEPPCSWTRVPFWWRRSRTHSEPAAAGAA